jgi:hypothetical protein
MRQIRIRDMAKLDEKLRALEIDLHKREIDMKDTVSATTPDCS